MIQENLKHALWPGRRRRGLVHPESSLQARSPVRCTGQKEETSQPPNRSYPNSLEHLRPDPE